MRRFGESEKRRSPTRLLWGVLVLLACSPATSEGFSSGLNWQEIASLPEPRWFHASCVDQKNRVYVFGGNVLLAGLQQRGLKQHGLVYLNTTQGKWSTAPEVPPYTHSSRYFVRSGGVPTEPRFVDGKGAPPHELPNGACHGSRALWFTFRGPLYFDGDTRAWGQAPAALFDQEAYRYEGPVPLYRRMASATAVGADGRLWLLGGWGQPLGPEPPSRTRNREGLESRVLASLEVYDPVANTYIEHAPMRQPRWLFAATFGADGKLYAFGGFAVPSFFSHDNDDPDDERKHSEWMRQAGQALRSVEVYDPATDTWSPRAPLPEPRQNMAAALGADGKIYVIGGLTGYSNLIAQRSVFVYDPATDSWSDGPPLRTARQGHTAVATKNGRIYAIGGTNAHTKFSPGMLVGGPPGEEGGPLASVEVMETKPEAMR